MEVDISDKVNRAVKLALAGVAALAVAGSIGVWQWQRSASYLILKEAAVSGELVNANVKASGKIAEFLVGDGEQVRSGDVIARLNVEVSPEELEQLEAAVQEADARYQALLAKPAQVSASLSTGGNEAEIAAAQAVLDRAAKNKERMDNLFAIGGISAVQHRQAAAEYQSAAEALRAARQSSRAAQALSPASDHSGLLQIAQLQLKQAQAALDEGKKQTQASDIIAPVSGVLHYIGVKVGDSVEAGQTILKIGDAANLWLEIDLDETRLTQLKLGQFVEYTIADFPGRTFKGTVFEIAEPSAADEPPVVPVKISLPVNSDVEFMPGMRAEIKIGV